jgi:hypothetical protein
MNEASRWRSKGAAVLALESILQAPWLVLRLGHIDKTQMNGWPNSSNEADGAPAIGPPMEPCRPRHGRLTRWLVAA